jgi:hypothetical protein
MEMKKDGSFMQVDKDVFKKLLASPSESTP